MKKTLLAVLLTALLVMMPVMASAAPVYTGGGWTWSGWSWSGWIKTNDGTQTVNADLPDEPEVPEKPADPSDLTSSVETLTYAENYEATGANTTRPTWNSYTTFEGSYTGSWTWTPYNKVSDALDPQDSSWFYYKEAVTLKNVDTAVEAEIEAPAVSIPASGVASFALVASVLATLGCAVLPKK